MTKSQSKQEFSVQLNMTEFIDNASKLTDLTHKELLSIFNRSLSKATTQSLVKEARRDLKSYLSFSEDSTGETARSLGVKSARRKALVLAGARVGGRYSGQLVHILDQGTTSRTTKNGANRGRVLGLNFYAQAIKSKGGDLEQKFNLFLNENYLKRIIKKI